MPGICGYNGIGTLNSIPDIAYAHSVVLPVGALYTAVSGDVIDQFHFYGNSNGIGWKGLQVCLYTHSAGLPVDMVGSPVPIVVPDDTTDYQWHHSVSGLGFPLVAGTTYCIGWTHNGARHRYNSLTNATRIAIAPLPNPWVDAGSPLARYFSIYADIITASSGQGGRHLPVLQCGGA